MHPKEQETPNVPATGRLSVYVQNADEVDLLIINCGAHGYSFAQMAACVGVATSTLRQWAADSERFASVLERAKTLSQAWWEGRAMDGTAQNHIGASVWVKSMTARFPQDYAERRELSSPDGTMSPNRQLTAEELAAEMERRGIPVPQVD
jgi:hypothetical protein